MRRVTSTATAEGTRRSGWSGLALLCAAGVVWGTIGPAVDIVHDRSSLSVLTIGAYRALAAMAVLTVAATATIGHWCATRTNFS